MNQSVHVTQLKNVKNHSEDVRLPFKPRKHAALWQIYLWWNDLVKMRVKHVNRLKAIERGKSDMIAETEEELIKMFELDRHVRPKNKKDRFGLDNLMPDQSVFQSMVEEGQKVGLIWDWLLNIKGIGESLAAQIIAQIDDIEKFDTVAKLWRYCGYGIYEYWIDEKGKVVCPKKGWKWIKIKGDKYRVWTVVSSQHRDVTQVKYAIPQNTGLPLIERTDYLEPKATWKLKKISDRKVKGYHCPFNTSLKSIMWNITDMFIKHQTPFYSDLYYAEKTRLRELHPEKVKINGVWKYTNGHIDNMAKRKTRKEFIKNLWIEWKKDL